MDRFLVQHRIVAIDLHTHFKKLGKKDLFADRHANAA